MDQGTSLVPMIAMDNDVQSIRRVDQSSLTEETVTMLPDTDE
jgi:hypothetical protein